MQFQNKTPRKNGMTGSVNNQSGSVNNQSGSVNNLSGSVNNQSGSPAAASASPNRSRLAYLASLTLLFSYAEALLPRFIPFFRLGLGNIAILFAFELPFTSFLTLSVIKSIAACLMSGTLFSPFAAISLSQSIFSGAFMYALFHIPFRKKLLSIYGISAAGSALSATIQIALSSLYLGSGTASLLGPMLIFNTAAGIFTAFLSQILNIPKKAPVLLEGEVSPQACTSLPAPPSAGTPRNAPTVFKIVLLIVLTVIIFATKNLYVLCALLILSFTLQALNHRKIMVLPHISLWIFVLITTLLTPTGKVIVSVKGFPLTQGAILVGAEKAIKLSATMALSQCMANLKPAGNSLLALTLRYYQGLMNIFNKNKSFFATIKEALAAQTLTAGKKY